MKLGGLILLRKDTKEDKEEREKKIQIF